jgi:phage shock protein PspC (stress-responsive transcriptional regulator)
MKKIININLSGRVIPIEDSAYESLQRYVESLRRYFANEEGRDEIINDIESRIAELMNDKIRKGASAVTEADIEEIIQSMGRVEDFEEAETIESATAATAADTDDQHQRKRQSKGRLYRDNSDKLLGGVCSGIASYMNVDPSVIRLLFAIITFGGFGFGFLLYILLWIILPAKDLDTYVGKRLFRNPDDKIIGGVAGGLAAYFNKSAKTIRIIFAAPLILNIFFSLINGFFSVWRFHYSPVDIAFGSITSTFILVYIVLWIVLPEARSNFEKMEMRGEKVDVNSIRQNIQEGMGDVKSRAQAWGNEVKDSARQFGEKARDFAGTRGKTFAQEASQAVRPVAKGIGHAIGVLFKAFFIFVAGSIAFGLFVGLMVLIFGGGTVLWPLKQALLDFVLDGFWQKLFFWGTVLFFIAVPLIAFLTWLIRRIMRRKSQRNYLGWTFAGLWMIGIFSLIGLITSMAHDFSIEEEVPISVNMSNNIDSTLVVTVTEPRVRFRGDLFFVDADNNGWNFTDDSLQLGNVRVDVDASKDSNYHVVIVKSSRGRSSNQAEALAQRIRYNASSYDSLLDLGSGYALARSDKFRGQEVEVQILVPIGKKIRFDESVAEKFYPFRIRMNKRYYGNRAWNYDNVYVFGFKTNTEYTMNASGRLQSKEDEEKERQENLDREERRIREERLQQEVDRPAIPTTQRDSLQRIREQQMRLKDSLDRELRRTEQELRQDRSQARPRKPVQSMSGVDMPFVSILI